MSTKVTRACSFCSSCCVYTCPRCSADYCGLKCYQSSQHRACSEKFYKECVEAELVGENLGSESKAKMQEILRRMKQEEEEDPEQELDDSDDDLDPIDLADRLAGVDLEDTEQVWSLLSVEERKEFDALVASGDVASVLPEYIPWWKNKVAVKKIKDIDEADVDGDLKQKCPEVWMEIPSLVALCKNPSPYVKYGLLNLLYAYAYAVKYFSGDYCASNGAEFVEIVQLLAGTLEGHNFQLADTAVEAAASEVNNHQWLTVSLEHSRSVKKDVFELVKGPTGEDSFYILAALSDLRIIFLTTLKRLRKDNKGVKVTREEEGSSQLPLWLRIGQKQPELKIESVRKHLKKIEFYLSWTLDFYHEAFKEL